MFNVLTEQQKEKLILQLAASQKEFTEDDVSKVLVWASKTVVDMALLDMVLSGNLVLSVQNGDVFFEKPKPSSLSSS